uniref:Ubiquitin carrier protein n=1 Tax=Arundo donax TaxID=35708 RepID=A0A0A9AR24_ARUDO
MGSFNKCCSWCDALHQSPDAHLMPARSTSPLYIFHSVSFVWWCWSPEIREYCLS